MNEWFKALVIFIIIAVIGIGVDLLNIYVLHSDEFKRGSPTSAGLAGGFAAAMWYLVTHEE